MGFVDVRCFDCTVTMPTDFACVLDCFNSQSNLTETDVAQMSGVLPLPRLRHILTRLSSKVDKANGSLLSRSADGLFSANDSFSSR